MPLRDLINLIVSVFDCVLDSVARTTRCCNISANVESRAVCMTIIAIMSWTDAVVGYSVYFVSSEIPDIRYILSAVEYRIFCIYLVGSRIPDIRYILSAVEYRIFGISCRLWNTGYSVYLVGCGIPDILNILPVVLLSGFQLCENRQCV